MAMVRDIFFLLISIHFCETTTSLLLQHQQQVLRGLKEIIIWLIMATGEFLLHKKQSWYESDKSSMVSSHVNSFQSQLYTGIEQKKMWSVGFYRNTWERRTPGFLISPHPQTVKRFPDRIPFPLQKATTLAIHNSWCIWASFFARAAPDRWQRAESWAGTRTLVWVRAATFGVWQLLWHHC